MEMHDRLCQPLSKLHAVSKFSEVGTSYMMGMDHGRDQLHEGSTHTIQFLSVDTRATHGLLTFLACSGYLASSHLGSGTM